MVFYRSCNPGFGLPSSGKTVLLLHGQAFTSQTWQQDVHTMQALCAMGHRVIAVDLPSEHRNDNSNNNNNKTIAILRYRMKHYSNNINNIADRRDLPFQSTARPKTHLAATIPPFLTCSSQTSFPTPSPSSSPLPCLGRTRSTYCFTDQVI